MSEMQDYSEWTKDALIKRLQEYESGANQNKSIHRIPSCDQVSKNAKKPRRDFDFSKYNRRRIALKFSYLGWNYHGLAYQNDTSNVPTVELFILKALEKTKLISNLDPTECDFSRCGRTDKGVSAMNQVISLTIRSNLTEDEMTDPLNDVKELDYVKILNKVLPEDIRIHSICLRPPEGFDARFSCLSRHYKYFFEQANLNIEMMQKAASYFVGEHDFRNFCKVDGSKQIVNYRRKIISSSIERTDLGPNTYVFNLKGSAFLWHQVRSMMSILILVGQELEEPEIVRKLLDVKLFPSRPNYTIASPLPLVLYDCEFDSNVVWSKSLTSDRIQFAKFDQMWRDLKAKYAIVTTMKHVIEPSEERQNHGSSNCSASRKHSYTRIEQRECLETPDNINKRWLQKRASGCK
ncbi:hypothetical protein KL930_003729 [Ogataea haglerorum]|uniref:Pseudouridine synthase I TruA alpha/beta domain-containing protein n=1 Tax=Ogataea haglerorum TaxID=1937702 RepID=A0AAN6D5E0_9ASCO|nr:uncharacterized protein KL911_003868 [Ogataea haglerorum]KAG7694410.1 hypothetical protein KL915_003377 [Ogataea haglerorum]KAG7695389.1 hypothetical protein KL951_003831 [Ogataea haglerorum]KAG7705253.1 hypothetical protein KL914_003939 [Ogataea haglerorum]KAG7705510.1 hypothetical protein KL950_003946 [Ogataea haglerorum]KAG7716619.1 hypothetical protein KL913_003135 [Ogataea haglerorum]